MRYIYITMSDFVLVYVKVNPKSIHHCSFFRGYVQLPFSEIILPLGNLIYGVYVLLGGALKWTFEMPLLVVCFS